MAEKKNPHPQTVTQKATTLLDRAQTFFAVGGIGAGVVGGVIWIANILTGRGVPDNAPEWAKGADQLYSGSKKDPQDEIAMTKIRGEVRKKYIDDLPWWDGHFRRVMLQFGDSQTGRKRYDDYNHEARQFVVQMREKVQPPPKISLDPTTKKQISSPSAVTINYEAAVEFIHEVVEEMKNAYGLAVGTTEEKYAAADQHVDDFFRQHGFPVPNFNGRGSALNTSIRATLTSLGDEQKWEEAIDHFKRARRGR